MNCTVKFAFNVNITHPANIYLFKVNNKNTRKRCKIYSKLIIKTLEQTDKCLVGSSESGIVEIKSFFICSNMDFRKIDEPSGHLPAQS